MPTCYPIVNPVVRMSEKVAWTRARPQDQRSCPMSGWGQSRRFGDVRITSAFPLIADVRQKGWQVRKVPKTEVEDSIRSKAELQRRSSWRKLFGTVFRVCVLVVPRASEAVWGDRPLGIPRIPSA